VEKDIDRLPRGTFFVSEGKGNSMAISLSKDAQSELKKPLGKSELAEAVEIAELRARQAEAAVRLIEANKKLQNERGDRRSRRK